MNMPTLPRRGRRPGNESREGRPHAPNRLNVATNYAYDNLSRLQSVLRQLAGSTIDGNTYTVDNAGNRTAKTDQRAAVTSNYGFDAIYELTSVTQGTNTTESYTYDPVGNRLSSLGVSPYSINVSNQLTSTPNTIHSYDNSGNMLTKIDSTGTTSYAWDFENRLTGVTLPGSGGTASFKYDPFGRRIQKSFTTGANPPTTTTTNYLYDGDNGIEEVDPNGSVLARYSQGLNIDEPLAMLRGGATSYYHADGLGSVTSLSNPVGALAQTYSYDSFGKPTTSSGSLINPFQYTARELDSETGLYFLRARYYNQSTGRFVSEDPVGFDGDAVDFFAYANENPTNVTDPFGLQGTATAPAPTKPISPPIKAPPIVEPPLPTAGATSTSSSTLGRILGVLGEAVGDALNVVGAILFSPIDAGNPALDYRPLPKGSSPPCKNNGPDCTKATPFHLEGAGIGDPHAFKREYLGNKAKVSRFDICACKDGSIIIKPKGTCGSPGPGIPTGRNWQ